MLALKRFEKDLTDGARIGDLTAIEKAIAVGLSVDCRIEVVGHVQSAFGHSRSSRIVLSFTAKSNCLEFLITESVLSLYNWICCTFFVMDLPLILAIFILVSSSVNKNKCTALILAAQQGHIEVCVKLAELGANLNLADSVSMAGVKLMLF